MTPPATPNYVEWKFWIDILVLATVAANTGYTWWSNREKVTSARFSALEKDVAERLHKSDLEEAKKAHDLQKEEAKKVQNAQCELHRKMTTELHQAYDALHVEVSRLPDRREITKLDNTMKDLAEKLGNLDGRISGINRAVDIINGFLIEQGGKK